jgi:hypothetical protein
VLSTLAGGVGAVVLVLSGGDGDETKSANQPELTATEAQIAAVVEQAAATRNADDCARLATRVYLEEREHLPGEAALAACQDDVFDQDEGLLDEPVEVLDVVDAETQGAAPGVLVGHQAGSDWAGLTALIRVVDGKLASIDEVLGDRKSLDRAVRHDLIEGPPALPKPVADCAVDELRTVSDDQVAAALVFRSPQLLYRPVLTCDRRALARPLVASLSERWPFLSRRVLACGEGRLAGLQDAALIKVGLGRTERPALAAALACDTNGALAELATQLRAGPPKLSPRVGSCVVRRLRVLQARQLAEVLVSEGLADVLSKCR